ncbi:Ig-like domain-containing protein, partial [Pseudomonas sp. 7P_10.2_Bac1]|uniref:Ig-like domain-containing protein n=1 Tax=Pseudomonas sp. 7P_10.2_Bac1 TaxID=2971614 RepID=UPI0021C72676
MKNIVIVDKATGATSEQSVGTVGLKGTSIIKLPFAPESVQSFQQSGQNLVITLKSGETFTIQNFFVAGSDGAINQLVLEGNNGELLLGQYSSPYSGFTFSHISSLDDLTLAAAADGASSTPDWVWWGLGLLAAGGAAAALGGGGGGGGHHHGGDADVTPPATPTGLSVSRDGLTVSGKGEAGATVTIKDSAGNVVGSGTVGADGNFQVPLNTPKNNGETLDVILTDAAGNQSSAGSVVTKDTTAPDAPTGLAVSADGQTVSGKGEPGSTVTLKDSAGNVIGTGTVGADGNFSVKPTTPQNNGQTLDVTLTDAAGNVSQSGSVVAGDTTPPAPPTELVLAADGVTFRGKGEPASQVTVKDSAGNVIGTGTVGADGNFTVILNAPRTPGEEIQTTLTDAAQNQSAGQSYTVQGTVGTAPDAPTDLAVSADGLTVSGKGRAGSTVTLKDSAGNVIGTGTVGTDGTFALTPDTPQKNGQTIGVTLTDASGNISPSVNVVAGDTTAPEAPTGLVVSEDGLTLSGKGEPGSTITIKDPVGNVIGSGTVGADGNFEVTLDAAQTNGETLEVTLTDANGNVSAVTPVQAGDTTAPEAPTNLAVSADGVTLTGKGEAGSTVTVKDADGNIIGSGTVGADGSFEVTLDAPQNNGGTLEVTLTDAAGNVSEGGSVVVGEAVAPEAPTGLAVSADGLTLTGKGEAGSTVTIKDPAGNLIGTGTVGADGNFSITLEAAQTNGETLSVTQTNAGGLVSPSTSVLAGDTTAPEAPTGLVVSEDGLTLSGKGEPGSTITIKDPAGNVIGSGTVGADGNFEVTLDAAQTNGETLEVTLTDANGNVSAVTPVVAKDTTAPEAPTNLAVSADGVTLTGKGEAGSTVTVKDADGNIIGSGTVGTDGTFEVTLDAPQNNGGTLEVTLTDAAGNVSEGGSVVVGEAVAPEAPTDLAVSADGLTLTGKGEAGSTVTIKDPAGNVIGTGTVGADGNFSITLDAAQTNGETLSVTQTNAGGLVSPSTSVLAGDTTAPEAPTGLVVSEDGLTLTGKGEPGSTITIKDPAGNVIGSGTVGADGNFEVTLDAAQTNGETLEVTLTDANGNVSAVTPVQAGDTTAPEAPTNLAVSADGVTLTGKGEAGSTVTVKDADGNIIGSGTVGTDGTFEVTLDAPQNNGGTLEVTLTDAAGNVSEGGSVVVGEAVAPEAPTGLAVSADGLTLTGKGEAGSTVTIKDPAGNVIGTGTVGADGNFSITLDAAQTNGETLSVTQTNAGGLVSPSTSVLAGDTTAPEAPTGLVVSEDGLTLTGKGEPGSTITIKDPAGNVIGSGTVGADGNFEVTLDAAQTNGETLEVTLTDANGNVSAVTPVQAGDTTAPEAPTNLAVSADGVTLTGKGEAGSTVTVKDGAGNVIGSGTVGTDGSFEVTLDTPQNNGGTLEVTLTDAAGNVSEGGSVVVGEAVAPEAPTGLAVSADGLTLTGKGEAGSTVTIKDPAGNVIGTGTVGADGNFSITLYAAQTNGETLSVTQTNAGGLVSPSTSVLAGDTTAPEAPTGLVVSEDGLTLTGKGEPGSTITIKDPAGNVIGSGTVGADGNFEVTLDTAQTNGETLEVTLTDANGNVSAVTPVQAGDTTAPEAPTNLAVSADGVTLTGKGEVGSTVTVKDADGNIIGSGTVGADGSFEVTLDVPQNNGGTLEVTLTDAAGNVSEGGSVVVGEAVAPEAPTGLAVSADGLTLTGKGEAGSTVTIKDPAGNVIGTGTVGADGNFSITLDAAQTNGETLSVTQTNAGGLVSPSTSVLAGDTTAPEAPTGLVVSEDGLTLTGKGEPGSTITIKDPAGNVIGSGTVGANGNFEVTLDAAQTNGETLEVTLTDANGNVSAVTPVQAGDTTAPEAPTGLVVSEDGLKLTGKGEVGSTVTVKDGAGNVIGSGTVGADGNFEVTLDTAQTNGETLEVTLTDAAGNISAATPVQAGDTTAPEAPTGLVVSEDGLTVTGKGEPGSTITIKDPAGNVIGSGTVGADGNFEVTLDAAQTNGETLEVTLTDANGNVSAVTPVQAGDTTAPEAPTNLAVSADGVTLTGKGEAGSTVTVKDADGNIIGSGTVGTDGTFEVTLDAPQNNGGTLEVTLTDAAGNVSEGGSVVVGEAVAPEAPTGLAVSADGLTLTGKGEAGSTVTIKDPAGNVIGTGTVGADGNFSITLDAAQTNGETLSVTQTNAGGLVSPSTSVLAGDTTAPEAPTGLVVSEDGLTLTGKGEPGSTITIKDPAGNVIGSGTVGADGNFEVTLDAAQTNGETLEVTLTDANGNVSAVTPVQAGDTTAPEAPTGLVVSEDGLIVTGKGEPGSTITIKDPAGNVIGAGTVGADGNFEVTLDAAQTNGETLEVTLTDAAGNISAATPVQAGDTTAPEAPTGLVVSEDGLTLSGKGEPGSTITIKDPAGNVIGAGTVGADGNFEVTLDTAQTNGETLEVTLTDANGNVSAVTPVQAGDTTAPEAPTNLAVSADGVTLTGKGEVGSTVTVKDADGNVIGSGTVGTDGSFEVTLDAPQNNGGTLEVTLTDAAGNVSEGGSVVVGEAVAPEAPTGLAVSADGLTLTGKGEAGSTVTIKDPAGNVIGTGTVGADGNFSITLDAAQTNGETLSVTQTNAGGLVSPSTSVLAGDTTAPEAPTGLVVSEDGLTLSGKGEPGSTITIKDPAGNVIGSGTVGADGNFEVTLDAAQTNGETLEVTLTDANGNVSAVTPVQAGDTTAPEAPTNLAVSADGVSLTGKGEAGSTVTVKDADGNIIGSGTVGTDGTFEVTLDAAQTNGETLEVTLTDAAGNISAATPVQAGDTTAPEAPTGLVVSEDGLTLTGKGEPGSTITIKDPAGNVIGAGTVGADGNFEVTLDAAQTNGETLEVTLTDANGNVSAVTPVVAKDTTAPDAPTNLAISADGVTLTGKGEAGSTVTVKDADGNVIGSGTVGTDGTFEVTLDAPQNNGGTLEVTLTDAAGNVSEGGSVVVGEAVAPEAPTGLAVSADGLTLTGKGEAGSTVTIKDPAGNVIGTGTVGADGNFSITLDAAQTNGETLAVSLTNAAGLTSPASSVVAGDTSAPDAPTNLAVSTDGLTLSGKGEVGSIVTVKNLVGLIIGSGVVEADGTFAITLDTAQNNGQTLNVTLTDASGNVSAAAPVTAGDTTAPEAATNLVVSADGLTLTGKGEAGSTVSVKDATGAEIGTGIVGEDGNFSITLDGAQTNGETLNVTLTDAAGNISEAAPVTAGDTTAPEAATNLVVSADGLTLTGKGEAGTTVTIRDDAGKVIGSGTVNAEGDFEVTLDTAQTNGQTLNVTLTDPNGNVSVAAPVVAGDTTAPEAPTNLAVSADGLTLTGKGEAGSTVSVKDAAGAEIGTGTVGEDGNFSIILDSAQTNGETLNVSLTDAAGNISEAAPVTAGDTTAPNAPTNLALSTDGLTLTGKGEAGSTVTIRDDAGKVIGSGTVNAEGDFEVTLDTAQTNGQTLNVTLTDPNGNVSVAAPVVAGDTTAPEAPTNLAVSADGLTLTGKGEAGSTVSVKDAAGLEIGTGTVGEDGTFEVILDAAQLNGGTLQVTLTDAAGNVSQAGSVVVGEAVAPEAPTGLAVSADGVTLTGKGEAGSTVTIKDPAGNVIGSGTVDADGNFSITLDAAQTNGETLSVTQTNAGGLVSPSTSVIAGDTTAPEAPTGLVVSEDGLTVTGKGEPDSTITIKDPAGNVIGSGTVGADGNFEVTLDAAQTNGETLEVTLTDANGNVSAVTPVVAKDTTAPEAPTNLAVSADGVTLTGKGEAGSTVSVKDAAGVEIGTGTVNADGNFSITLDAAQTNGETINVTLTDAAGNISVAAPVTAGDTTAPEAATNLVVSVDGLTLTGKGEAGSTVSVKDAAGAEIGTGTVGEDGNFSIILESAQTNGETLNVTLTDAAGNISVTAPVTAGDTTAPEAATNLAVSADGLTLTGKGEAGSTVSVKDAAGAEIGTGTVGEDGNFSITLDSAQTNGETLNVTLTDAAGNISDVAPVTAGDTTAPEAATNLAVSVDGLTLTGKGEAGSTVSVKDAAGAEIGTGTVGEDGNFSIILDSAQTNGETLNVTLTDAAGNISDVAPVTAGDTTAPEAATNLVVSADGLTLTGKGEAGSTVSVKDAAGAEIGTGTVGEDGNFSIILNSAQTNGETLNVTLTDAAGNISDVAPVTAGDTTAPEAATNLVVSADGLTLTGKGEAGSTVSVKDAAGAEIGTGTVGEDGNFSIPLDSAQTNGETLNVTLTDAAGNISVAAPVVAGDTTAPDAPTNLAVSGDGLTLTGKGEVGSTVIVKDAAGLPVGTGVVGAGGNFEVVLNPAQGNGATLEVTLTDKAGNVSAATPVVVGDAVAPGAPTDLSVSVDGLTLSGKGEAGTIVTIKTAAGTVIGSGTVDADGNFSVVLESAQTNGETLGVTLSSASGLSSPSVNVVAGDTTAPEAPTNLVVGADGLTLTGKGEAGSTVSVKDAAGLAIGTGTVGEDGNFSITLDAAQTNGETLTVTLTDKAGNVSAGTPVIAGDTTAPAAPTELEVSENGLTLTGKGEAGSIVTVKNAAGVPIGTGIVDANGSFTADLDAPQKNGESLTVTLTDKAGNESLAGTVTAGDTTAPDAPTALIVSVNGLTLEGKGEAGTTVTVKDALGVQIGTGVVDAEGNFAITLDSAQTNGETLTVTLTDKAGNVSVGTPVIAGDTTAPAAPTELEVSESGLTLTGKGEAGSVVTVKNAAGVLIGTGIVDANGSFTANLDTPQKNGETLNVTLTDKAGNVSAVAPVIAGDTTAPAAATELKVSANGLELTGKGEAGSTVIVKNAAGVQIGTGTVGDDGSFNAVLNTPQKNGETLTVTLTDKAGNESLATQVIAGDTTAPAAPTELKVSVDGLELIGKGEAGSVVSVKNAAGVQIGTGLVGADGSFTVNLNTPQKNGETLNVTLTDKAGNVSDVAPVIAGDTTAPAAATELKVSANGLELTGKGEAGSTVSVKDAAGLAIGTGTVDEEGNFSITLDS